MVDITQINYAEICICGKSKMSSNRVFDYFLTEAKILIVFKLNFFL